MAHDAGIDNPYTRGIAEFVSGLQYDAIPQDVRSRIKLLMLDSLGCALFGANLEWTRISAAAGSARALDLDAEKTVHALGIAGTQAAGLMAAQYGAMVKRMHAGRSSQSGLYGALFAEGGFTGIVNVLESEYGGFCTMFSRSTDRFNLKELTAGFGEVWQTMGVELELKDGTRMERTVESARGSEKKFASEADIVEKFEKLAVKALPKTQVEDLRDAMLGLEKLPDATRIARLLAIT